MAVTRTVTYTKTYARTELLKLQVQRVLTRSTQNKSTITNLLKAIEYRWLHEVSVYGMDGNDKCHAELFVRIDWSKNALHMSSGRDTVQVDAGWEGGVAAEIDSALQTFELVIKELGLRKYIQFRYTPDVDQDMANRKLGFSKAKPVQWRSGYVGTTMNIYEIDEMDVGVNLATDE